MFSTEKIYQVVTYSVGDTKAGTKMGKLQLKSLEDSSVLNCILWEETINRLDEKLFRCGNHLRIVSGSFNEKYNNCLVSALELVKEARIGLSIEERDEYYSNILKFVEEMENSELKQFINDFFEEHEEKIKIAPAAKMMHHNYLGGLLVHTYECLKYAQGIIELFESSIDKDTVFAACILHDIGKIFEYKIDENSGLIDYEEDFRKDWVSHSQYGFSICMTKGFKLIAKMIAAHHARADWGAIIDLNQKDLEPILYLLHHIDDLSAKFGKISISQFN